MSSGSVRRATFWLAFTVAFVGVLYLFDPISRDEINCGSAAIPKSRKVAVDARAIPEQCQGPLRNHRWIGGAAVALGTLGVNRIGPLPGHAGRTGTIS